MNIKKLFLAWQNPKTRLWFPIGMLTFDGEYYHFVYTYGVKKAQSQSEFHLVHSFPEINRIYHSVKIFPLFANRLMPSSRPDYPNYINWLNITKNEIDLMDILTRSNGKKVTDTFEVFPYPEKNNNGNFQIHFFIRGLRYMPQSSQEYIQDLKEGNQLFITQDCQNTYDSDALLLRTENKHNLGYCPQYFTQDILHLLKIDSQSVKVCVEKINLAPAPIQLRILCKLIAPWNNNFTPFKNEDYQPIVDDFLFIDDIAQKPLSVICKI